MLGSMPTFEISLALFPTLKALHEGADRHKSMETRYVNFQYPWNPSSQFLRPRACQGYSFERYWAHSMTGPWAEDGRYYLLDIWKDSSDGRVL